ncbi:MAG: c-type cytochrome [Filimonas sp.]|nr:c-type cytochrome [Filimonas sp.]
MKTFIAITLVGGALILSSAFRAPLSGKSLFTENCIRCHGEDGTRGFLGAKNLRKSTLADSAIILKITNGRRIMPSFKKRFTPEEIREVMEYVKTLRKT